MIARSERYNISGDGRLSAEISTRGAALVGLYWRTAHGNLINLVLDPKQIGYDDETNPDYVGVIVGRVCGRIRNGTYTDQQGKRIDLSRNQPPHHLHGGGDGAPSRLLWTVAADQDDPSRLTLECQSPDGAEGYPGQFTATARYQIDGDRLILSLAARCDVPGPINLTAHPYFNLAGTRSVPATEQILGIAADRICALDGSLVPTGETRPIEGQALDFRLPRRVGLQGLDTIFLLDGDQPVAAQLTSPHSGVSLSLRTDQPVLVAYDGAGLPPVLASLAGGICLEPQDFPLAFAHMFPGLAAKTAWHSQIIYHVHDA